MSDADWRGEGAMEDRQRSGAGGFPALLLLEPEHLRRAYRELENHPHPLFRWIIRPLIAKVLARTDQATTATTECREETT